VLFSHHQPFTQLDTNQGGNLLAQMEKVRAGGQNLCVVLGPRASLPAL
jgi:hypothetical protein